MSKAAAPALKTALVTGLNGRLAPHLKRALNEDDVEVVAFDRTRIDISNRDQQQALLISQNIDAIFHLATGPESWVGTLAGLAREQNIPFVFTSTESVFEPTSPGPFTPAHPADATSDYGQYKIACEQAACQAHPDTLIARLGWQMFDTFDEDNLLTHVRDMHNEHGVLEASTTWLPAVAHVRHTMEALIQLAREGATGTYHIDGNQNGLSFHDLVTLINRHHQMNWNIRKGTEPTRDGRIVDPRLSGSDIAACFK
ncbi:sugar nucleotide-binding protein [Allohahella sp. A8]|uniref:sugar nucleotide-binding protein n=1 Tax=Allohahella sp. A8 TaxID=3141461 RepID=UPI003A80BACD